MGTQTFTYVDGTSSGDEWLQQMLEPNLPEDVFDGFPGSNVVTSDYRTLPFVVRLTTKRKGPVHSSRRTGREQVP
jgi:hypothetical protein